MTQPQRASYEKAAEVTGLTMTQWATQHLDLSARRDIDNATSTTLSPAAFEEFCAMLNEPLPDGARDLLSRKAVWE